MNPSRLFRIGGLFAIASGILIVLARVFEIAQFRGQPLSLQGTDPLFLPLLGIPGLLGSIFFLLGITTLYAFQSREAGLFGLVSFLLAFIGMSLSLGANWTYAFGTPYLASTTPVILDTDFGDPAWGVFGTGFITSYLFGGLGYMMFSISTFWAGKMPRWVGLTMFLSMLLAAILPISLNEFGAIGVNMLMAAGPVTFGAMLWRMNSNAVKDALKDAFDD